MINYLENKPVLSFGSIYPVEKLGGLAVLVWKKNALLATSKKIPFIKSTDNLPLDYKQIIVYAEKSRKATISTAIKAWSVLPVGGKLFLYGKNEIGIKTTCKKVMFLLGVDGEFVYNKQKSRMIVFCKIKENLVQEPYENTSVKLSYEDNSKNIKTTLGVFSAEKLDKGTIALQKYLKQNNILNQKRILDIACGVGNLGFFANGKDTEELLMLDADCRSVACAKENASSLDIDAKVKWWDSSEIEKIGEFDLVLINPPFHEGKSENLNITDEMFNMALKNKKENGKIIVVANQHLPYEKKIKQQIINVHEEFGYKIIEF